MRLRYKPAVTDKVKIRFSVNSIQNLRTVSVGNVHGDCKIAYSTSTKCNNFMKMILIEEYRFVTACFLIANHP